MYQFYVLSCLVGILANTPGVLVESNGQGWVYRYVD